MPCHSRSRSPALRRRRSTRAVGRPMPLSAPAPAPAWGGAVRTTLEAPPEQRAAYLARYTHRVAISNRRLIAADAMGVTFKYKDYRIDGPERYKLMTLATGEFIRRFLMHILPKGFHRIREVLALSGCGLRSTDP